MVMTSGRQAIFLDTNILIQLHVATAPKHTDVSQAVKKLLEQNREIWISRQVLREYAAVLTRTQPYTPPLPAGKVANQLRLFETSYRIADENAQATAALCVLMDTFSFSGKQIHDANIVASMQTFHIHSLFTLNIADFTRFSSIITLVTLKELLA